MWGYESFLFVQPDESESMVRVTELNKEFDVSETTDADGKKVGTFTAQESGYGVDNPAEPGRVTLFQATKAVNYIFSHNASGRIIFNYKVSPLGSGLGSGRNLVFAGTGKQASCQPPAAPSSRLPLSHKPRVHQAPSSRLPCPMSPHPSALSPLRPPSWLSMSSCRSNGSMRSARG